MKSSTLLLLVPILFVAVAERGTAAVCVSPEGFQQLPLRREFGRLVEVHFLEPGSVEISRLTPVESAKLLGYALARQARFVGDDRDRQMLLDCLVAAVDAEIQQLARAQGALLGSKTDPTSEDLSAILRRARLGYYDEQVEALTGVDDSHEVPSVFAEVSPQWAAFAPLAREAPKTRAEALMPQPVQPVVAADSASSELELHACRFNIPPSAFDGRHADWDWYLLERPWREEGFQYVVSEVRADLGADDDRRPENRLSSGQRVVLRGSKKEVVAALGEARLHCR